MASSIIFSRYSNDAIANFVALKAFTCYILFTLLLCMPAYAQQDSVQADTGIILVKMQPVEGERWIDTLDQDTLFALYQQSFFQLDTTRVIDSTAFFRPAELDIHTRNQQQQPRVFYMFVGMLMIVALLRVTQSQVAYNYFDFPVTSCGSRRSRPEKRRTGG